MTPLSGAMDVIAGVFDDAVEFFHTRFEGVIEGTYDATGFIAKADQTEGEKFQRGGSVL